MLTVAFMVSPIVPIETTSKLQARYLASCMFENFSTVNFNFKVKINSME